MKKLNITLVQPNIIWEDREANLKKYSEMLAKVRQTNLIVLPEMFTTGFSMNPERLKETLDGPSVQWMKDLAKEKNAAVAGSLIIEENKKSFNRFLWVFPDGKVEIYDKHETVKSFEISYDELHQFRKKFPLLEDRDEFYLGTSNSNSLI
jgi:omega-amidase